MRKIHRSPVSLRRASSLREPNTSWEVAEAMAMVRPATTARMVAKATAENTP